jgi:serine protease Do
LALAVPLACPAPAQESGVAVVAGDAPYVVATATPAGHPYLGVRAVEETEADAGGARVTYVVPGSPADAAGIRVGDVLERFGDQAVHGPVALTRRIHEREPGDSVAIRLRRGDAEQTVEVELGRRGTSILLGRAAPDEDGSVIEPRIRFDVGRVLESLPPVQGVPPIDTGALWSSLGGIHQRRTLGVQLVETTPELREHLGGSETEGVLVSKVLAGQPAAAAGIEVGDLILEIAGTPVATVAELRSALAAVAGTRLTVQLARKGRRRSIEVILPNPDDLKPTGPQARSAPPSARGYGSFG